MMDYLRPLLYLGGACALGVMWLPATSPLEAVFFTLVALVCFAGALGLTVFE